MAAYLVSIRDQEKTLDNGQADTIVKLLRSLSDLDEKLTVFTPHFFSSALRLLLLVLKRPTSNDYIYKCTQLYDFRVKFRRDNCCITINDLWFYFTSVISSVKTLGQLKDPTPTNT